MPPDKEGDSGILCLLVRCVFSKRDSLPAYENRVASEDSKEQSIQPCATIHNRNCAMTIFRRVINAHEITKIEKIY